MSKISICTENIIQIHICARNCPTLINMATFAEAEAHTHMDASKWTTRYIDSREASTTFFQCVDDNGDLHIIEGIWRLIKAFMIMSDEHMDLCRRASASRGSVVVRYGAIVPFLYFANIFNRRAGTVLSLSENEITDISALGNALNTNSTLTKLGLSENQITSEDREILRTAWKREDGLYI